MSRKKAVAIVLLAVVALSAVVVVLRPVTRAGPLAGPSAIAVIRLSGPIAESGTTSLLGAGITPRLLERRLEEARENPAVKAVVLRLDTGGGTVAASQEMAAMVRDFPKPVVVSMGDVVASGGYYVASQADRIVAQPGTLTGSIGVIWTTFDIQGLLDKLGVSLETVTAGKHKDMFLPGRLTPERRRILQEMTDQMYEQFVQAVARGRGLPLQRVRQLATGQPYTGQQALELGLVDRLGGLEEAIEEAKELAGVKEARVVELSPSLLEEILSGSLVGDLRSLLASALPGREVVLLRQFLDTYAVPRYGG